jgi:hypothetical protein
VRLEDGALGLLEARDVRVVVAGPGRGEGRFRRLPPARLGLFHRTQAARTRNRKSSRGRLRGAANTAAVQLGPRRRRRRRKIPDQQPPTLPLKLGDWTLNI